MKYPYPVLDIESSSYKSKYYFNIKTLKSAVMPEKILFEFKITTNSEALKSLCDNGKANVILRVETGLKIFRFDAIGCNDTIKCSVPLENIAENDNIKFRCYIVASDNMVYLYNSELLDYFDSQYQVKLNKNDILAISNEELFSYTEGNNDFLKLVPRQDMNGKGYKIEVGNNYVKVVVGTNFNGAYSFLKRNQDSISLVFGLHIGLEVLVYLLVRALQEYDDFREYSWFKRFEQSLIINTDYESFEEFSEKVKSNDYLDMDVVLETAHKMMNNKIENTIISMANTEI